MHDNQLVKTADFVNRNQTREDMHKSEANPKSPAASHPVFSAFSYEADFRPIPSYKLYPHQPQQFHLISSG